MSYLSLLTFALAALAYTISQLQQHGKLKWSQETLGFKTPNFWETDSWMRKYKQDKSITHVYSFVEAPKTWYYTYFKVPYKESFTGSATIFTLFTDGYHLMQFVMKILLAASIALYRPHFGLWDGVIYWLVWSATFHVFYKILSK